MEDPYGHKGGKTSTFLNDRGFGWMLETSLEDDEDVQLPLLQELDIDLSDILRKLQMVLLPRKRVASDDIENDDADFWGPLFVVLFYSMISLYGQFTVVSWILTIWVVGSLMVFVLARVLCGEVTYSQCIGIIGYSLLPLSLMSLMTSAIPYYLPGLFIKLIGVLWSTYSASCLLCVNELARKNILLIYPIFLLYSYFLSLYSGV